MLVFLLEKGRLRRVCFRCGRNLIYLYCSLQKSRIAVKAIQIKGFITVFKCQVTTCHVFPGIFYNLVFLFHRITYRNLLISVNFALKGIYVVMASIDLKSYILGTRPTNDDKTLTGSRLPTEHAVLLCFLAHRQCPNSTSKRDAANKTVEMVLPFYNKAAIPTIQKHIMAETIEKLATEFENLLKLNQEKQSSGKGKERIDNFKKRIQDKTMKFWPRNVFKMIHNAEDKKFLQSMMTDRRATITGKDSTTRNREKRKQKRRHQETKRLKRYESNQACHSSAVLSDSTTTNTSTDDDQDNYSSNTPERKHRRLVKTGVVVHIPPDILRTLTVAQSFVLNKISSTAISAVMHEIITAAQGDPSKLSLSYSSTERYKLEAIENL